MGQKTHPYGFRLGYNRTWHSRWFAEKDYADILATDIELRERIKEDFSHAGISEVDIERQADRLRMTIYTSRPGIVIGRKGAEVDALRDRIQKKIGQPVHINIQEVQRPELDAQLVAQNVAYQLTRRVSFRRAMKKAMESAFRFGAKGFKIMVSGRLGGHEFSRTEWYQDGRLPLHTLKADIDYGLAVSKTTYGTLGVKVWVYKGDLLKEKSRPVA